jgi:thioredoxin-related protein
MLVVSDAQCNNRYIDLNQLIVILKSKTVLMKKNLLFASLFFVYSFVAIAQDWHTNMDEAKQIALTNNERILLVFQGSDWCGPCIKLDAQVFKTKEFQSLVKDKFVMLKADFPRKKVNKLSPELEAHNSKLAETYNNQGFFPLVVVLDKNGKVLGKLGYENLTPSEYYKKLMAFK